MEDNLKRLNKFIGETGIAPTRVIKSLKKVVLPSMESFGIGHKVSPHDEVRID
jgi:hypothetical protein